MKKVRKIAIFSPNTEATKVIERNGVALDSICCSCTVDENVATGNYFLDAIFIIDKKNQLYKRIKEEAILKVAVDYGEEIFEINYVKRNTKYITIVARQITIPKTLRLWIHNTSITSLNGTAALDQLLAATTGVKDIKLISDIQEKFSADYTKISLYKALHDNKNSFGSLWGGEILRRGYSITINSKIGTDKGVAIRSRKNLQGYEDIVDMDSLCTRGIGTGAEGIEGDYIDSHNINKYSNIYTKEFEYSDIKVKKSPTDTEGFNTLMEAKAEINKRVLNEFLVNKVDELRAQYNLSFLELEKTEEGKEFSVASKLYPGDSTPIYEETLDIHLRIRVIRRKYNVMAQKVIETELSNLPFSSYQKLPTITNILDRIDGVEKESNDFLNIAKDHATAVLNAGLKNSYVSVRTNEILVMDTQDINTAIKVWRWNNGGLGYSSTGYYGRYSNAITSEGEIVADFIKVGILNANLIKAGVLKSFNEKTWINMEDGTFNFANKVKFDGTNFSIKLSSGENLEDKITQVENDVTYNVEIISTNGSIFKNGQISTKLIAVVRKGKTDITSTIDANKFRWTRVSDDKEADIAWNTSHLGGTKEITVTRDDVRNRATFNCAILE